MDTNKTVRKRYEKLDGQRKTHLNRARQCSKLTIPHLLPEDGHTHNKELPTPYQSFGSKAVNNLASKLWLSLFPPGSSFFKLSLSLKAKREWEALQQEDAQKSQILNGLAKIEETILTYMENRGVRTPAFSALRQLVTTGNVCAYIPNKKERHHEWSSRGYGLKVFPLDQYVVVRDPVGNLVELVIKEEIGVAALPEEVRKKVDDDKDEDATVDLFTRISRKNDDETKYEVTQEVEGTALPNRGGEYDEESLPWLVLRWSQDGDYGRGPIEEYLGDLQSLESLSKALVEGSLGAAKVIFLANPNGMTRIQDLTSAENMEFRYGREEDVTVLRVDKHHDFSVAQNMVHDIERRLSEAFLMHSSVQRDAERVTAEEIRYLAQELEDVLGGVYSILSQEFQLPIVQVILHRLQQDRQLPSLPKDALSPVITTGIEALGRNHEQAKLREFMADIAQTFGPEMSAMYINPGEYIQRAAINQGINTDGLIRSEEEVQQMMQQQKQQETAEKTTPVVAGKVAEGMLNQGGQQ